MEKRQKRRNREEIGILNKIFIKATTEGSTAAVKRVDKTTSQVKTYRGVRHGDGPYTINTYVCIYILLKELYTYVGMFIRRRMVWRPSLEMGKH